MNRSNKDSVKQADEIIFVEQRMHTHIVARFLLLQKIVEDYNNRLQQPVQHLLKLKTYMLVPDSASNPQIGQYFVQLSFVSILSLCWELCWDGAGKYTIQSRLDNGNMVPLK